MDAEVFEGQRPRLFSLAYRMLGSASDAEDVVQEAWLRAAQQDDVREPAAYLTTVVTRLCLDALKSARARRETYVGPWLPEPVATAELGPLETAEQREGVSFAALYLLERLTPAERAVVVLRDAFDHPYAAIADAVGLSEAHCRQLHRRARERLDPERPKRFEVPAERQVELALLLFAAAAEGDVAALTARLTEDVVLVSDGGGKVAAARRPVTTPDKVARFLVGVSAKVAGEVDLQVADVNGQLGMLVLVDGEPDVLVTAVTDGERVSALHLQRNPDKLRRIVTSGAAASSGG